MERTPDRRVRRTRALLRQGLAQLMGAKSVNEVTVTELVDLVDINRSTFYLHYRDIPHMLECVEQELYDQVLHAMEENLTGRYEGSNLPFLEDVFSILFANRDICAALLGPRGDIGFLHRIEEMLSHYILTPLQRTQPDVAYRYGRGLPLHLLCGGGHGPHQGLAVPGLPRVPPGHGLSHCRPHRRGDTPIKKSGKSEDFPDFFILSNNSRFEEKERLPWIGKKPSAEFSRLGREND